VAIEVIVQGAEGTTSEAVQQQAVIVGAPTVAVSFSEQPLAVEVQGGGVEVTILAPGYSEPMVAPQHLNDLLDVQAAPADGSLLQYSESETRWIAGCRLVFRPALRAYLITELGG